jgi:hypothetical protein
MPDSLAVKLIHGKNYLFTASLVLSAASSILSSALLSILVAESARLTCLELESVTEAERVLPEDFVTTLVCTADLSLHEKDSEASTATISKIFIWCDFFVEKQVSLCSL